MKTVGIIGGLGPETSAKFQLEIISSFLKNNKKQRPPILSWNVPLPIKIEEDLIIKNFGERRYLPFLSNAAKILEKAGADFLVMPCNTMHIFIEEIRGAVDIPVLSIIDETVLTIKKRGINKIGILATSMTISKDLFQTRIKTVGVEPVMLGGEQQHKLDRIIQRLATGQQNLNDKKQIDEMIAEMVRRGVKNILLACTDLQLIVDNRTDVRILDTMRVLAKVVARKINERDIVRV